MSRRLLLIALGAAAAAAVIRARRKAPTVDASGNGGATGDRLRLRRAVGEVRQRLRADAAG
jgi:hypothetical protein